MKIVSIPVKHWTTEDSLVLGLVKSGHKVWTVDHERPNSIWATDRFVCFECHKQNIREAKPCT